MKRPILVSGILILLSSTLSPGSVMVDFDAAVGPADVVGDITVVINIGADGTATLGEITSTGVQAAVEVSGTVTKVPAAPYTVTLLVGTGNGRQTGIGLIGVANNFIDADESMLFSFNADNAGAGTALTVTEVAVDPDNASFSTAGGTLTDAKGGTLPVSFSSDARASYDVSSLDTTVTAGSGLVNNINLNGTAPRFQFAAISFDMVEGGSSPPTWAG